MPTTIVLKVMVINTYLINIVINLNTTLKKKFIFNRFKKKVYNINRQIKT